MMAASRPRCEFSQLCEVLNILASLHMLAEMWSDPPVTRESWNPYNLQKAEAVAFSGSEPGRSELALSPSWTSDKTKGCNFGVSPEQPHHH